MEKEIDFSKLKEPFPSSDIEWRLQSCGETNGKIWAKCLAYVTNRAIQNRLEYTINNLNTTAENMTAAESTIRDVDMAEEIMEYTKNNILQQAAQAMLVQANQRPTQALQLLQ